MTQDHSTHRLYKVLSITDWEASQESASLKLPPMDELFIHFATEEQLEHVIGKFWADAPSFVILTIDPAKLPGRLVYECNKGGSTQYYHLYDGFIPLEAVIASRFAAATCR